MVLLHSPCIAGHCFLCIIFAFSVRVTFFIIYDCSRCTNFNGNVKMLDDRGTYDHGVWIGIKFIDSVVYVGKVYEQSKHRQNFTF